jgi:hypothetical protein
VCVDICGDVLQQSLKGNMPATYLSAVIKNLSSLMGSKQLDNGSGNLPKLALPILSLLYRIDSHQERMTVLGLSKNGGGGLSGGVVGSGMAGGGGGGGSGSGGVRINNTSMCAELYGQSGYELACALRDDVKNKQLSNFEVEHISILAGCVKAQCIDNVSTPLNQQWTDIYNDVKSWVLVALCDPDAASLAALIVELYATKSALKDIIVQDELLLPSLKLCFPQGGGAGDPICEAVFGSLLRRLANLSGSHRQAVLTLLNNAGSQKFGNNSPLALIASDLEE